MLYYTNAQILQKSVFHTKQLFFTEKRYKNMILKVGNTMRSRVFSLEKQK